MHQREVFLLRMLLDARVKAGEAKAEGEVEVHEVESLQVGDDLRKDGVFQVSSGW